MTNVILGMLSELREFGGDDSVAMHIAAHDVSAAYGEDNWANLAKDCVRSCVLDKEQWELYLQPIEIEILKLREKGGETGLQTKGGKWKLSKVSHNSSYRSNKSVLGNALDAGLAIVDSEGKAVPKSQLEKLLKGEEIAGVRVPKSAYERALSAATTIISLWPQLSEVEQAAINGQLFCRGRV